MNVVIYQSFIIYIFVLFYGVHTLSVQINGNVTGLIGENGTEIRCSYNRESVLSINSVSFFTLNRSTFKHIQIAFYIPNMIASLTDDGHYLTGRVTLMNITQQTTEAVLTLNNLMCIDDTLYQCQVNYVGSKGVDTIISNSTGISVQVPPSKPDSVSIVSTPVHSSLTSTKHMEYSTKLPSTAVTSTPTETETLSILKNQNDTNAFHNSTIPTTDYSSLYSSSLNEDLSSDTTYEATTFSPQQTTTPQDIITEGDNITVVCTGDVGNPPVEYIFHKYRSGHFKMAYTATETSILKISENCSYYRTSNLTFQVTAEDNQAVIRCVVNSSIEEIAKLYKETAPIDVNYAVRIPNVTKYPNKEYYVVGKDTSIHLTCKSEGNPQPEYFWYKESSDNHIIASENLTIMVTNKTQSEVYTCRVRNTFSGDMFASSAKVQVHVRNEADTSTLPSSSTDSSSGSGEKYGNPPEDLTPVYIGVSAGVVAVLLVLLSCFLFKRKRKGKDESTETNGSTNNLMHYSSKHGGESRPGGYDSVILEGDAPVMSSSKKEQSVEDVRKHNEEYMKNQTNESKSPTSDQPVIYAEVNKANKSNKLKDKPDASNQHDDDTYAGTQEGIYDQSGNSRHKVDKNAEQFDKIGDVKKQNSTDDAESSLKSSQKGSYINHALNKGEKQVATVPPISRSSVGSQGDEQTTESIAKLSQTEYENVKGTDTSDGHTINQTSL